MKKVDMSEEAVLRRLEQVDQLRELGLMLLKSKRVSDRKSRKEHAAEPNEPRQKSKKAG